jgi:hypothetical protein
VTRMEAHRQHLSNPFRRRTTTCDDRSVQLIDNFGTSNDLRTLDRLEELRGCDKRLTACMLD